MDKRYQVFVSSTYEDLQEERKEVMQALLELDCIPAGMELFPASNDDQWTLIKKVIDDCDYYILIIGGRYGSTNDDGISYTQMEFEYALNSGKPIISFLPKDPSKIPNGKCEKTDEGKQTLEKFKEIVQKKLVNFWSSPDDLGSAVSRSMYKLIKSYPAVGWIKGNNNKEEECITLQKLNLELNAKLAELNKNTLLPDFIITYHKIAHEFRNTFFKFTLEEGYDKQHLDNCFESLTVYFLNKLTMLLRLYTNQIVSACLKVLLLEDDHFDFNTARVKKIGRSTNSSSNRKYFDKNHEPSLISENTCYDIIFDKENDNSYVYIDNIENFEEEFKMKYINPNKNQKHYYKSTVVVPIKIEKKYLQSTTKGMENDPFEIVGFLCLDSNSTSAFKKENEDAIMDILYSFTDLLYVVIKEYKKMESQLEKRN